jgi:hypothetical protein
MKRITIWSAVLAFVMFDTSFAQHESSKMPIPLSSIATSEEAATRALLFTGFDLSINYSPKKLIISSILEMAIDTITPLSNILTGNRAVWRLDFEDILLDSVIDQWRYPSNFSIYFDSATGLLLKIQSDYARPDSISDAVALEEISAIEPNNIQCNMAPRKNPTHSFIEILKPDGRQSLLRARQYTAYYLYCSLAGESDKHYWCLVLRGGGDYKKDNDTTASIDGAISPTINPPGSHLVSKIFVNDNTAKTALAKIKYIRPDKKFNE